MRHLPLRPPSPRPAPVVDLAARSAQYAGIFLEAWMRKLDGTEPEYAELAPPAIPIMNMPPLAAEAASAASKRPREE